jgi:anti-sigma B factor antagonist
MKVTTNVLDTTTTLMVSGPLDFSARKTLGACIEAQVAQGRRDFILDLHRVTFMDSSGLGALVACFSSIRKQGGAMRLVRVSGQVRELIDLTKLTHFFDLCDRDADVTSSVEC